MINTRLCVCFLREKKTRFHRPWFRFTKEKRIEKGGINFPTILGTYNGGIMRNIVVTNIDSLIMIHKGSENA